MLNSLRRIAKRARKKGTASFREVTTAVSAVPLVKQGYKWDPAREWARALGQDKRGRSTLSQNPQVRDAQKLGFLSTTGARFLSEGPPDAPLLSERDYAFISPPNGSYDKWLEDRITTLAVFQPFQNFFQEHQYHVLHRDGELQVIPLAESSSPPTTTSRGIANILQEAPGLVLRPSAWQSQEPPVAASWTRGTEKFQSGWAPAPDESFVIVQNEVPQLQTHSLPPTQSLRVLLTNWEGTDPVVAEAYLRTTLLASSQRLLRGATPIGIPVPPEPSTQAVTSAIFESPVDVETGRYVSARAVVANQLYEYSADPLSGARFEGCVRAWREIRELVESMGRFAPQLEFVEFDFAPSAAGPKIIDVKGTPEYGDVWPFSPSVVEGLQRKVEQKKAAVDPETGETPKLVPRFKRRARKQFAKAAYPAGLVPYQSVRWLGDMRRDFFADNGVALKDKFWAYRNGFLSYRLPQYGITPETRSQHISDFEYRWLRHINRKYKDWLEDKVTIKYVARDFNQFLPDYYYFTSAKDGRNHLVPMMDLPEGYAPSFRDVLRLVRDKGILALKPDEGSHGAGFFCLDYEDDAYFLNGEEVSEDQVIEVLSDPENQYLITEYIVQHPEIGRFYPTAVITLRMTVFKPDGVTPRIGNAYLRVGSSASGYIDNTGAGRMIAEVDLDTGRIHSGGVLQDGKTAPMPYHPDTGVALEGQVPHWEYIKENVLKIASALQPLEFFGFDIAVTEDGFKLPEINRYPDYPRISLLTPETNEYLLRKVEAKKAEYGYDKKRPRRLITLPRRD